MSTYNDANSFINDKNFFMNKISVSFLTQIDISVINTKINVSW